LLAYPNLHPENDPPQKGSLSKESSFEPCNVSGEVLNLEGSEDVTINVPDEYVHLQRRILIATIFLSIFAIGISAVFFDLLTTSSVLVGAFFGLLYLRLLARSIGKLGKSTKQVSKIQLIVPVLLVLAASKLPQLELLPALFGFLLYKPSLIIQMLLES